jgi:leader peptidase (prepilin peptidase)/N-methyltransferase
MMESDVLRAVVFGLFGLVFGSFLTVVVYRLPRKESVVAPRSACPTCGTTIRARDNIPIASYALLGGRCRNCHTPVSAEYPLTEAITGALFAGAALAVSDPAAAAVVAPFLGVLLGASLIDARHKKIPNRLTYPSLVIGVVAIGVVWALGGELSLPRGLLGLAAYGGSLLLVAIIAPSGMGLGDVKLAALIGLVLGALGWGYLLVGALLAMLTGGVAGVVALAMGKSRRDTLPFGPFLALGAAVAVFLGPAIAGWYTHAFV